MKKMAALVAFVAVSWSGAALAAEALLIRHEVLTVPVGQELALKPGFFIGKAWMADPTVAGAGLTADRRAVAFNAKTAGRTIVSTWSLREPNKRIEYEIVVVNDGERVTPALPVAPEDTTSADAVEPIDDVDADHTN